MRLMDEGLAKNPVASRKKITDIHVLLYSA